MNDRRPPGPRFDVPTSLRLVIRGTPFILLLALSALVACSRSTEASTGSVGYGTAMADVARRFELLGLAAIAGRYELAEYQLGEIEEQFTETLPHALPPREGHPEVLPAMASAFTQTTIADLRRGLAARDRTQFDAAFERAATACNGCHQASGHGFIDVPTSPGRSIPNTDPKPR